MRISSRTGSPIYEADASSMSELVAKAIAAGADLSSADLRFADLSSADLSYANLSFADLSFANLRSANLRSADLSFANLSFANLRSAKEIDPLTAARVSIVAQGDLIVWKKLSQGIAKLLIPADAKRSNATGRKCRAEFAKVLELPEGIEVGTSQYDFRFEYRVGEIVRADNWCDDRWQECAGGIHFFLTREEAEAY